MRKISLKRPLLFFDLETTGVDVLKSRIVSIAAIKVLPNGSGNAEFVTYINPQCPIPLEASAVHGITDEMVKDSPTFAQIAVELVEFIFGCDIAGFNSNRFDVPLLMEEFKRAKVNFSIDGVNFVDVRDMFVILKPRTLGAAFEEYTGEKLEGAHDALIDIKATIAVFMSMFEKHSEIPETVEEIAVFANYGKRMIDVGGKFAYNDEGKIILTFGMHKDKEAASEKRYLQWMLSGDFGSHTKEIAQKIIRGELY